MEKVPAPCVTSHNSFWVPVDLQRKKPTRSSSVRSIRTTSGSAVVGSRSSLRRQATYSSLNRHERDSFAQDFPSRETHPTDSGTAHISEKSALSSARERHLNQKLSDLNAQIGKLVANTNKLNSENAILKKKATEDRDSLEKLGKLKKKNAELAVMASKLEEKASKLEHERERVRSGELEEKNFQLQVLQKKCDELKAKVRSSGNPAQQLEGILKQASKERLKLEKQFSDLPQRNADKNAQIYRNRIDTLEEANRRLSREVERLQKVEMTALRQEKLVSEHSEENSKLMEDLESGRRRCVELEEELNDVLLRNTKLSEINGRLQESIAEMKEVQAEVSRLSKRLERAELERTEAEQTSQQVRANSETLRRSLEDKERRIEEQKKLIDQHESLAERLEAKQRQINMLNESQLSAEKQHQEAGQFLQQKLSELEQEHQLRGEQQEKLQAEVAELRNRNSERKSSSDSGIKSPSTLDHTLNKSGVSSGLLKKSPFKVFKAKYNYDPVQYSPNDHPELELNLCQGDYIFVYGDIDQDGFYEGELMDGRRGLVPSNFIQCVPDSELDSLQLSGAVGRESAALGRQLELHSSQESLQGEENMMRSEIAQGDISVSELDGRSVPHPQNLRLDRQLSNSLLVAWAPPAGISIDKVQAYHVFVDGEFLLSVRGAERTKALLEGITSSITHRISVRTVTSLGQSHEEQCTILVGKDATLTPSELRVTHITATTATVAWLPGDSNYEHVIAVNHREIRCVQAGVHRVLVSGLLPSTMQRISIRPKSLKMQGNSASIQFTTLNGGLPEAPMAVQVECGPQLGTMLVTWLPVTITDSGTSNGSLVIGYVVYIDARRAKEVRSPTADHVILQASEMYLEVGPKHVTVRTMAPGFESNDSRPTKIPNTLLQELKKVHLDGTSTQPVISIKPATPLDSSRHIVPSEAREAAAAAASIYEPYESMKTSAGPMPAELLDVGRSRSDGRYAGDLHSTALRRRRDPTLADLYSVPRSPHLRRANSAELNDQLAASVPLRPGSAGSAFQRHTQRRRAKLPEREMGFRPIRPLHETRRRRPELRLTPDVYSDEERLSTTSGMTSQSPISPDKSFYDSEYDDRGRARSRKTGVTLPCDSEPEELDNSRLFVALYDYEPSLMSPNADVMEEEIAFKEGQIIKIYGEKDADGYYVGELHGRRGYVPSNMVQETRRRPAIRRSNSTSRANRSPRRRSSTRLNSRGRKLVSKYDYDPVELSPNLDAASQELCFKAGELLTVYGQPDADGFYDAELNGARGLVPSNFLQIPNDSRGLRTSVERRRSSSLHSAERRRLPSRHERRRLEDPHGSSRSIADPLNPQGSLNDSNLWLNRQSPHQGIYGSVDYLHSSHYPHPGTSSSYHGALGTHGYQQQQHKLAHQSNYASASNSFPHEPGIFPGGAAQHITADPYSSTAQNVHSPSHHSFGHSSQGSSYRGQNSHVSHQGNVGSHPVGQGHAASGFLAANQSLSIPFSQAGPHQPPNVVSHAQHNFAPSNQQHVTSSTSTFGAQPNPHFNGSQTFSSAHGHGQSFGSAGQPGQAGYGSASSNHGFGPGGQHGLQGLGSSGQQGLGPGGQQGLGPGGQQGLGPTSQQGLGPGGQQGLGPTGQQGLGPTSQQGLGPGGQQGQQHGFGSGSLHGQGQGFGPGAPGQSQGPGGPNSQGLGLGHGGHQHGPGQGQGFGPGQQHGQNQGQAGYAPGQQQGHTQVQGLGPSQQGQGFGPGQHQGPTQGQGFGPGQQQVSAQGQGFGPGQQQGLSQGQGFGPGLQQGPNQGQGFGQGQQQVPNQGQGFGPGQQQGPIQGQGFGPGQQQGSNQGQGFPPGFQQGANQGQSFGPGQQQGPNQGQNFVPGQQQGASQSQSFGSGQQQGANQGQSFGAGQQQGHTQGQGFGPTTQQQQQGPNQGPGYSNQFNPGMPNQNPRGAAPQSVMGGQQAPGRQGPQRPGLANIPGLPDQEQMQMQRGGTRRGLHQSQPMTTSGIPVQRRDSLLPPTLPLALGMPQPGNRDQSTKWEQNPGLGVNPRPLISPRARSPGFASQGRGQPPLKDGVPTFMIPARPNNNRFVTPPTAPPKRSIPPVTTSPGQQMMRKPGAASSTPPLLP